MQTTFATKQNAMDAVQAFATEAKEPACVYRVIYGVYLEKEEFHLRRLSEVLDPNCDRILKKVNPLPGIVKVKKVPIMKSEIPAPMFPKVRVEIENLWHTLVRPNTPAIAQL
jgi:hypothetical protein